MYPCRYSIDVEWLVHYYFCHSKGLLIRCYKCLAEFGKGISLDQDIFLTIPWWIHGGKIHTNKVHWSIANNGTQLCFGTYIGTFGLLTSWTILHILHYISVHSAPIKLLPAQGYGSIYSLMTLASCNIWSICTWYFKGRIIWWYSTLLLMYNQCRSPCLNVNLSNCRRYFHTALDLILEMAKFSIFLWL